jgi:hypothetical protein
MAPAGLHRLYGAKDVLAAPLDQPVRSIEAAPRFFRTERPKRCGDQRVLQPAPIGHRQLHLTAIGVSEPRRAIEASERALVALPPDAHHRVAIEAAAPSKPIHLRFGPRSAAERLFLLTKQQVSALTATARDRFGIVPWRRLRRVGAVGG